MTKEIEKVLTRGVAEVLPSKASLGRLMGKKKIRMYLGIDPTGSLLTLGHSVALRKLQQFAELGHQVILLIGNGTVRIGDPTGRDSTRPALTDSEIKENFKNWKAQASKVLDFKKIEIRYNGDWLDKLNYADIVRLLGKVTVQQLLERDMFQKRVKEGKPIFGHEIMYPMLQGYDSVVMDVDLEIGGTDQTFNMLMGRALQKNMNDREKWVLTTPLIEGTDGRKMSKSYGNYIALTDPPNEMFGKLMSIADNLMLKYFEVLTDEDLSEMKKLIQKNPRDAKVHLAKTIATFYHDEKAADGAEQDFVTKFVKKEVPDEIPEMKAKEKEVLVLIQKAGFAPSGSEARRLIQQGGVSVDGEKVQDPKLVLRVSGKKSVILKVGKRKFIRINF